MNLPDLFRDARTIAIVGCSPRESKTSHRIGVYLQRAGYTVVPVNPYHDELLGETCYASVAEIPHDVPLDIVNVYRQPRFTAGVVEDTAAWAQAAGREPVVWTQLGVSSPEAQEAAREAGLPYVRERCIMVEHGAVA